MNLHLSLFSITAVCALTIPSVAQDMIGVSWGGDVYSIDSTTGTGTQIGSTGFASGSGIGTNSMAIAQGTVWVTYNSGINMTDFQTVNRSTGAATTISSAPIDIRGFAHDGASTFYAIANSTVDTLYRVDPTTGAMTFVGATGFTGIQGLAHDGTSLYAWDLFDGLLVIDTTTGVATDVSAVNGGLASVASAQFLAVDTAGNLLTGRSNLFSVDKTNGSATLIGTGGYSDVRGADFTCEITTIGPGCPGTLGIPQISMNPCPASPGRITATTSNGTPNGVYGIGLGFSNVTIPFPNGCVYYVGANSLFLLSVLDGSGQETFNLISMVPAGFSGLVLRTQSLVQDSGAPGGFVATPGLEFTLQ